jgi:hypothetical protein
LNDRPSQQNPPKILSFSPTYPFSGTVSHLRSRFGVNAHEVGIVTVIANRRCSDSDDIVPQNVADLVTNFCSNSSNDPNQWIYFGFKEMKIWPVEYTIRMTSPGPNCYNLMNWFAEGSIDGSS